MKKYKVWLIIGMTFCLLIAISVMAYAAGQQYYFTPHGGEAFVFETIRDEAI